MSILRFIGIILMLTFLFTGCSPKISQIEYDRKNYELEQLKIRYNLLQQETDGNTTENTTTTKVSSEINVADYNELKSNYKTLLNQNVALENAYNTLKKEQDIPREVRPLTDEENPEVSPTAYEVLKTNYENLLSQHAALEKTYHSLKTQETLPKGTTEITSNSAEHEQLKVDYETLLNQKIALEEDYKSLKTQEILPEETLETATNSAEHEQLKTDYEALLSQKTALEKDNESLKKRQKKSKKNSPPGSVPMTTYNELKIEKTDLEKRYTILENRYNALNERTSEATPSSIASAEILEPTELNPDQNISKGIFEREENSIDLGETVTQSASHNGLYFDFDTYTRTNEYLVLEVAVKNNSQTSLKTFWNTDKIEITDQNGNTYTSTSFRIGVDYNQKSGTLLKKINDENTVFARFAFEDLPSDLKQIVSLEFVIIIDGEQQTIKLTQIDISNIELD